MHSRTNFLLGALGAGFAASSPSVPAAGTGGARPGPYCFRLTREAAKVRYDFELELLDGEREKVRLGDYLGSAVSLNFFATWCGPCNAEADRLVQIASTTNPTGSSRSASM